MNTDHLMETYRRLPVIFSRGQGNKLWDTKGRVYLDAISGIAVTNLGHAHPEIAKIIGEQANSLIHTSNHFGIEWQSRLGERLCRLSSMNKVFFCNSGCEANETALKLARLHGRKQGITMPMVVVMENSFHGRTLATNAASGNPKVQTGFEFEPLVSGFLRVPFDSLDALRKLAQERDDIAAILVEPIQGEGGVRMASPTYLGHLRDLCDSQGWLLMLDEIQTGIGRTGTWFSYQYENILPDVLTLAKALGNGMPIGACLARGKASTLLAPGSHGSTFGGNPLACRVAYTVLDIIERDELVLRAASLGNFMLHLFKKRLMNISGIQAIRGRGLMIGIELSYSCTELVESALLDESVLINVTRGSTLRLLPSMLTTDEEAIDIVERVSRIIASWLERRVSVING